MSYMPYIGLFVASVVFEFAYIAWTRAAVRDGAAVCAAWAMIVGALGLLGVRGALTLPHGWLPYLAGIGFGSWAAVRLKL